MPTMKTTLLPLLISGLLAGCATGNKDTILPQDGPTMKQVYDSHFTGGGVGRSATGVEIPAAIVHSRRHTDGADKQGYNRNAHNEIRQIFPRLRNDTLILYVFPHLTQGERNPVPGYSTAFTFYEKTEYALPGEVEEGY